MNELTDEAHNLEFKLFASKRRVRVPAQERMKDIPALERVAGMSVEERPVGLSTAELLEILTWLTQKQPDSR